jgi:tetratricopeptide (TPR) repeat protein
MNASKTALAIALAIGGGAAASAQEGGYGAQQNSAQPAQPQQQQQQQQQPSDSRQRRRGQQQAQPAQPAAAGTLTPAERALILPLETAITAQDWTAANAALAAAQAGVTSPYGRFFVGSRQLQIGQRTENLQVQAQAIDAMIASGGAPTEMAPQLVVGRARIALQMRDWPTAERVLTQIVEGSPNDVERIWQLAEVKIQLQKNSEALALYQRLLQATETAGQTPPEDRIKRALEIASATRQRAEATALGQRLVRAYPTRANWNQVLVSFRSQAGTEVQYMLDVRRLMRAAGAFSRQEDYLEFAGHLTRAGQPGEVKAVLDEGVRRGSVPAANPEAQQMLGTANVRIAEDRATLAALRTRAMASAATGREARIAGDTFYGYGQYAEAVALYRASLQKGGEDANLVNLRLGAALFAAGQAAEAQAAFRAVTGGDRAALAALWLLWIEHPVPAA